MANRKSGSTQGELVVCDLEFPPLQKQLKKLSKEEFEDFERSLSKIEWKGILFANSRADDIQAAMSSMSKSENSITAG